MRMKSIVFLVIFFISGTAFSSSMNEGEKDPILPEDKYFQFGLVSSNQISLFVLKNMDKSFFQGTGGNNQEEKDKRNVGTLKLILMVEAVLQGTDQGKEILQEQRNGNKNKEHIAEAVLVMFLGNHGLRKYTDYYFTHNKTLTVDQVVEVAEIAKNEIFKKLGLKKNFFKRLFSKKK